VLFCPLTTDFLVTRLDPQQPQHKIYIEALNPTIRGGFLCDAMGLGKTLVVTALIVANPATKKSLATGREVPFQSQWDIASLRPDLCSKIPELTVGHGIAEVFSDGDDDETAQPVEGPHLRISTEFGFRVPQVSTSVAVDPARLHECLRQHLPETVVQEYQTRHSLTPLRATLVVAPVSICGQWIAELRKGCPRLRIILYHGTERSRYTVQDFQSADVIVTTYETLHSQLTQERPVGQLYGRGMPHRASHARFLDAAREIFRNKSGQGRLDAAAKTFFPGRMATARDLELIESIASLLRNTKELPIKRFHFHRVILDESQKCSHTHQANLLAEVHSTHRWLCTGTPIQNNIESLNPLLQFLGVTSVFANFNFFRSPPTRPDYLEGHFYSARVAFYEPLVQAICSQIAGQKEKTRFLSECQCSGPLVVTRVLPALAHRSLPLMWWAVLHVLQRYMIRHIKTPELDMSISLPGRTIVPVPVSLTKDELTVYAMLADRVQQEFQTLQRQNRVTHRIGRVHIWLENLLRVAAHVRLVQEQAFAVSSEATEGTANENAKQNFEVLEPAALLALLKHQEAAGKKIPDAAKEAVVRMQEVPPEVDDCSICLSVMALPTMLTCFHIFCRECVLGTLAVGLECPQCRARTLGNKKLQVRLSEAQQLAVHPDMASITELVRKAGEGSKVRAIMGILLSAWAADATTKFVVFSRFNGFIGVLREQLLRQGVKHCVIDGSTTLAKRSTLITEFQTPQTELRVCVLSSRAGNAGLTLTAASHLILCEPNINSVVEEQAIGRIHRFGQTRPVTILRLYTTGTVEEKVFKLASANKLAGQGGAGGNAHEKQLQALLLDP
jgi:SNF2 family DNA or RNA helicase